jgi:hypothetical protein
MIKSVGAAYSDYGKCCDLDKLAESWLLLSIYIANSQIKHK